jgi:hypothetical protein
MLSAHPVSFPWDGEQLRSAPSRSAKKSETYKPGPRISLCIIDPENPLHYLEIRGHAS